MKKRLLSTFMAVVFGVLSAGMVNVSAATTTTMNVINITQSLDSASELTWLASANVKVSEADNIGGRNNVLKAEGLKNDNNNTVGVKIADGFAFQEGDVLTYSLDVYSTIAIKPDMWLRNHDSSLSPYATFFEQQINANKWVTVTKTFTYKEMNDKASGTGSFSKTGNYALYLRPRTDNTNDTADDPMATVYLDNFTVTVSRLDYEGTEPTPTPEAHQHTYGEWKTDGATNHKKTCLLCGDIARKAHAWNAGVITTEPTYTSTGIKTYTCTGCGQTKTEAVDKLVSPSERTTITVGSVTTCAENGITVPVSISKNAGLMGLTLQIKYDSNVLALTGATKGTALRNLAFTRGAMNENPVTFIWDGSSEDTTNGQILLLTFAIVDATASECTVEAIVKSACDDKLNTVQTNATAGNIAKKSHSYGSWMKNDNDTHKKVCECGKEITEIHNWNAGAITTPATHTKDGVKTYTCTTCGETKTEAIEKDTESHTYESYVADGAKNHKKLCSCGVFTIETHKWDSGVMTTQPTAGTAGIKTYTCTLCNYKRNETFGSRLPTENDTNLTVGNVTARSGDEITVPVSISKNVGITGLQLTFGYNTDALTLTKVTKGTALGNMEFTEPGDFNEERLVFVWDGQDADSSNGEILLLNFKVADTAVAGDYQIFVNLEIACDQNFNSVPIYLNNGTVKIANQLPGDVNSDKTVDVKDVMLTRRYVAGGYGVTLSQSVADVNKDGSVDVKDVMLMRRAVAGGYGVVLK